MQMELKATFEDLAKATAMVNAMRETKTSDNPKRYNQDLTPAQTDFRGFVPEIVAARLFGGVHNDKAHFGEGDGGSDIILPYAKIAVMSTPWFDTPYLSVEAFDIDKPNKPDFFVGFKYDPYNQSGRGNAHSRRIDLVFFGWVTFDFMVSFPPKRIKNKPWLPLSHVIEDKSTRNDTKELWNDPADFFKVLEKRKKALQDSLLTAVV
jgi:hypothetical protein